MTDFAKERLRAKGDARRLEEILQLECRERFGLKLAQTLEWIPDFRFPSGLAGEQATSDVFAAEHARWCEPGSRVLDMTCGLGIDALHTSRAGCDVTAIEMDSGRAKAAKANLGDEVTVIEGDSIAWLKNTSDHFDAIFIDPARRDSGGRRTYSLADCTPNVAALMPLLRSRAKRVIVKASPMLDPAKTRSDLGENADIIITGTPTECRELCAVIPGTGRLIAVTLTPDRRHETDLTVPEPITDTAPVVEPGMWLCEPRPAVMKALGAMPPTALCGCNPVHPATHLYISTSCPNAFPGRCRKILEAMPFNKRSVKALKGIGADIAVRNFPLSAQELRQRIGAREDSAQRLYGLRTSEGLTLLLTDNTRKD